ncbi:MAG: alpha/beta fold hydrolase [Paracoccaceae bacterium]
MIPTGWLIRDGLRLAVHDAGGQGTPVIFQHGLCGDARQTAEAFPDVEGFRRITLECRGHGASEAGEAFSIAAFADDVAALAESIDAPVVVGGISMGAAIATRLAVMRPDLVRGLILVRPAWVTESAPDNMVPNAEVGAVLSNLPARKARQEFKTSATAARLAREAPDNLASLMGFFDREPTGVTARLLTSISADGPGISGDDLRALALPALVCGTAEDAIHPLSRAHRLGVLIPGARFVELPPKGRDKPAHIAALHAAIAAFLKEI